MAENFDWVEGPAGSGGPLLAGDLFAQDGHELLLPAGYLVFGPADGPYTRVDTGSGLPVSIQNATLAATQSGSWTVSVANTLTVQATNLDVRDLAYASDSVTAYQGGTWTIQAVQSGTWNVGTLTTLTSITNPVTVQDGGGSLTVDGVVTASQGGAWNIANISGVVSLPTGAATAARQDTGNASLASVDGKITACNTGAVTVAASALPAGAATAAKQPALGVAGTASADILTVQGIAGMTALAVSGPLTDAQLRASVVSVSAVQSGVWNVGTVTTITNVVHVDDNGGSLTVDGTVTANQGGIWNVTNISGTISLPTGAATSAKQDTGNTSLASLDGKITVCNTGAVTVSSSALPAGAATAAKQAALGTAGTPSADVLTVQGVTGMTALKVDGSAVTQPVSGTFWPTTQPVSGTVTANQGGTWNVGTVTTVTNVVHVDDNAGSLTVDGTVTVQDGGGSLTVDGTVAATQQGTWSTRLQDGAGNAVTSAARGSERALTVQVVDASGNQVTSFGGGSGGTQYDEDAASAGGEKLTLAGAVRQDTPTVTTSNDGDYAYLKTDAYSRLRTTVDNTVTVQASNLHIRALNALTDYVNVSNTVQVTAASPFNIRSLAYVTDSVTAHQDGDWSVRLKDGVGYAIGSALRGTERGLSVQIIDGSGNQVTSFGGGTEVTEDTAAAANPTGSMLMARRRDSLASETTTDGDVTAVNVTAKGELYVKQTDAVPVTDNGSSLTVDGTITANQGGTWNVGTVSTVTNVVHVDDNAGSLTVDGTVSTTEAVVNYTAWDETTAKMLPVGGQVLEPFPGGAIPTGRSAVLRMTPYRAVQACLYTSGGTELTAFPVTDNGDSLTVDGTVTANQGGTWDIANVSGTVSLPTGAATAAKQPALGTAGTASADVLTVQGIAGMTAVKVDGSDVTQPVSGTVTANQGGTWDVGTVTTVTNVVHVDDNASSLTVDNAGTFAVQAAQSGNWSVRNQDGAGNALTSAARGSERALSIQVVDASGNQVTSFGGGTQYTEDAASAGGESLTLAGVVRQDTPAGSTSTDGDYTYLKSDSVGRLWVAAVQSGTWNVGTVTTITNVVHVDDNAGSLTVDNAGTFAVQDSQVLADNAGFTDGTSKVFISGYIYDEVAGTALTENDVAAARINANRAQIHILEDASTRGRYATVTASNALKVDASVAAVSAKAQDGAGNNLTSAARGSERALSVQIVDGSGNQVTSFGGSSLGATSSLSNVSGSATSVTVLASNASRKFAVIFNDSSALVYIKFGTTASSTSFTYRLGAYETLEVTTYSGRIDGIWASATGTARVTEVT